MAVVAKLPRHIAEREIDTIVRKSGWSTAEQVVTEADADSPGNVVMIELRHEHVTEMFASLGRQGVPAEKVAAACLRAAKSYLKQEAPVGTYLADQLLLPTALAAHFNAQVSEFRTGPLSDHSLTQINLIKRFLDVDFDAQTAGDGVIVRTPADGMTTPRGTLRSSSADRRSVLALAQIPAAATCDELICFRHPWPEARTQLP